MKLHRTLLTVAVVLGTAMTLVQPAHAQRGLVDPAGGFGSSFITHYYDVATSNSPSASGYGGNGSSGGVGDSLVRIVNGGDFAPEQRGTVCEYIYVFDDIEEMQACCGCPVTPDGVRTMSVINNLTKNFGVNRGNLNAGVIEIASATPNLFLPKQIPLPPQIGALGSSGWVCDPTFDFGPSIGVTVPNPLYPAVPYEFAFVADNVRAWMTSTEANAPVPAASKNLIRGTSVDEFQVAEYDPDHGDDLFNFCFFLMTNGSGTGACSCGAGDDFSKALQPPFIPFPPD